MPGGLNQAVFSLPEGEIILLPGRAMFPEPEVLLLDECRRLGKQAELLSGV